MTDNEWWIYLENLFYFFHNLRFRPVRVLASEKGCFYLPCGISKAKSLVPLVLRLHLFKNVS